MCIWLGDHRRVAFTSNTRHLMRSRSEKKCYRIAQHSQHDDDDDSNENVEILNHTEDGTSHTHVSSHGLHRSEHTIELSHIILCDPLSDGDVGRCSDGRRVEIFIVPTKSSFVQSLNSRSCRRRTSCDSSCTALCSAEIDSLI